MRIFSSLPFGQTVCHHFTSRIITACCQRCRSILTGLLILVKTVRHHRRHRLLKLFTTRPFFRSTMPTSTLNIGKWWSLGKRLLIFYWFIMYIFLLVVFGSSFRQNLILFSWKGRYSLVESAPRTSPGAQVMAVIIFWQTVEICFENSDTLEEPLLVDDGEEEKWSEIIPVARLNGFLE